MEKSRSEGARHWLELMLLFITLSPVIASVGFFFQLPDQLYTTGLGTDQAIYQSKLFLLLSVSIVQITTPILLRGFLGKYRLSDKNSTGMKMFGDLLRIIQILVFSCIFCLLLLQNLLIPIKFDTILMLCVGGLLLIYGYMLPYIPYLHPLGLRTTWTIKGDTIWVSTHRKMSVFWIIAGTSFFICPYLPGWLALALIILSLSIIVGLTHVYSYIFFRKSKNETSRLDKLFIGK
ncbi:SdpI family protein [Brevibacillus daliensis]|uniref:SdpI family protein n=1 Tax=Brevibacillus daliensis TaxID=2892995 RepID=UPI001E283EDB|nr:SdpI family protein [Brevibacillus daliensis]